MVDATRRALHGFCDARRCGAIALYSSGDPAQRLPLGPMCARPGARKPMSLRQRSLVREGKSREAAQMYESLAATSDTPVRRRQACTSQPRSNGSLPALAGRGTRAHNTCAQRHRSAGDCSRAADSRARASAGKARTRARVPATAGTAVRSASMPRMPWLCRPARNLRCGDAVSGVKSLHGTRARLQGSAAIDANRRMIVEGLRDAAGARSVARRASGRRPGARRLAAVWQRAARARSQSVLRVLGTARSWRARYPLHPANGRILDDLLRDSAVALDYPAQVALLLPLSGRQQAAATAVRDGFLVRLLSAGRRRSGRAFASTIVAGRRCWLGRYCVRLTTARNSSSAR